MPSAFFDQRRNGWIASYRGLFQGTGERLRLRVPLARILSQDTAKADATAFAVEVERYCRLIEVKPTDQDVAHALRLGAITDAQATALLTGQPLPSTRAADPLTIRAAALSHPSSQRDKLPAQRWGLKCLDDFTAFTGIDYLGILTLDHLTLWVKELRARGWAWDTRRHALSYLRRATKMGTRVGIPDVVAGMRIDHREHARTLIRVWTLDHLVRAILASDDDNERVALVLGGCIGLRPTEALRADVPDLDADDVLHVGSREAKNAASIRALPLPPIVAGWLRRSFGQRRTGPMLRPFGPRSRERYTLSGLHQITATALKGPPRIKPKDLRKTFATWASRVITADHLERFLGHETALRAAITERHYLEAHQVDELRPSARLLDAAITGAVLAAERQPRTASSA